MGELEVTIDSDIIQGLILGDRDEAIRQLIESIFNEVLETEMGEHLQAAKYERTEERTGSRNGYYD